MKILYSFMMSVLVCSLSMLVSHGGRVGAQPSMQSQSKQGDKEPPLRLTTTVVTQRYCRQAESDSSDNLRIKLRLRYTNDGRRPLVLYKHDNNVYREMISHSLEDATAQRYVWDLSLTAVTDGRDVTIAGPIPSASFVVLQSGQCFETETETTIFIRRDSTGRDADGLLSGEYVLQVRVSTWPESEGLAEQLRSRWQGIGTLWFRDVTSVPMPFNIASNRRLVNCP
jgi:hypothetical protein